MQSVTVAVRRFDAMGSTAMNRYYHQQQKQHHQSSSYWLQGSDGRTMEKDYIREGGARFDSSKYDIDNAFPYIDRKLQNLLGHFQKDFEGVDSADIELEEYPETIYVRNSRNPKFGNYGSFLPAVEKSPSRLLQQKCLIPVQNYSLQKSTNNESMMKTARPVNADPPAKLCSTAKGSSSGTGAREVRVVDFANRSLTANDVKVDEALSMKQGPILSNSIGEEKKTWKLRFKVNSDSVSNQKNTAIYTDLGLQPSTSPSLESSPNKSQMDLTEAESLPDLSPLSIIQIMTSYQIPGDSILSPLPKSVLELSAQKNEPYKNDSTSRTEKTKLKEEPILNSHGPEFKNDMQAQNPRKDTNSEIMESKKEMYADSQGDTAKKVKNDAEKKSRIAKDSDSNLSNISSKPLFKGSFEDNTQTISASNMGKSITKVTGLRTEESNSLANDGDAFLLKVGRKEADIYGNTRKLSNTKKGLMLHCEKGSYKKERQDQVKEAVEEIGVKGFVSDAKKANESNQVTKESLSKISNAHNDKNVLNDGAKGTTGEDLGQAVIHKKAGTNKAYGKDRVSQNLKGNINISKKSTKGQNKESLRASCKDLRKEMYDKDSLLSQTSAQGNKEHKVSLKVTAKNFCGDAAKVAKNEQVDVKKEINVAQCKDIAKQAKFECFDRDPSKGNKKEKNRELVGDSDFKKGQNTSVSKDHVSNIVVTQPLPAQTTTQDPALGLAAPVMINDNWVCCDVCEKWRLLPFGVEPSSLPKKWLCRMLNWLPGMNRCDVPEQDTTQGLYNLYGISQAQVQSEANQGKIELAAAVVSTPLHETKQAYQIQEPKALQSSKKIGNMKKGVVQRSLLNVSDTVKLSSSVVGKKELLSANSKIQLSESHMEKSCGSISLSHTDDEANLIGAEKQKHPVREEKLKRISGSKDCNTEPLDVRPVKVKRKMDNELKESKSSSKKAKTEASEAFLGRTEAVDLPHLKLKPSKPESKIFTSAKKANEDRVKLSKEDFLQEADPTVRVGPCRNDGEPAKLSGSKLNKFKDTTPKIPKHEMSDCSLAGDSKYKDQQQATKKRKLKEWKDSQISQQGLLETVCVIDHGLSRKGEKETEHKRQKASMTERTEPCGSKGDGKKHKMKKLSSNQDTLLDEMEGKRKVHVIKEHGMEQSTGCNIMNKVSNGTEPSKKNSIARPSCVSTTSSSSKVPCYPKSLATLQDARESPVESSVSSSPLKNQKVEKFSLARGNSAGIQALNDSGGIERKQFLKNKTTSENVYKQFVSTNDVEHYAADCKQDVRMEDCTNHNDVIDASNENRAGRVKSCRVQERGSDKSVYYEKGGDMLDDGGREICCLDSHSKGKSGTIPCKAASSSLQQSSVRERSSDWSLTERNGEAETNSNKVKPTSHSANHSEEQCHDFGLVGLANKNNQLEGSVLDTCSRESSRIPRESGRSTDGDLCCQMKPPMVNESIIRDNERAIANPVKKENAQAAANLALREATDLKQRADRAKKNGGDELGYTDLYFRASLKFLHGASILEPLNAESAKHGETQSMAVYTNTAQLCESCANAYQQNNDLAAAALAYKCMAVSRMRVVLAKNVGIRRDQHELQVALQMIPLGESPSSSASDVDNLNNHALMEKDASINPIKGVGSLPSSGNHVTVARSHQLINRILQHTSDVNSALEAFSKANSAFAAVRDAKYGAEEISALKKVIDFSFHDVDGLLHLVLLAMKAIDH